MLFSLFENGPEAFFVHGLFFVLVLLAALTAAYFSGKPTHSFLSFGKVLVGGVLIVALIYLALYSD